MAENSSGLTRRGLFRSIGTATIVAGCVPKETPTDKPEPNAGPGLEGAFGATPSRLAFTLDGQQVEHDVEGRTTLLELLRLDLDKTGTKLVCDRGSCGACMVLVDKVPRNSCMLLAHDVAGAVVTTVAGLGQDGRLSPLQHAFIEHDALQCGFCTSGMLISATALLDRQQANGSAKLDRGQVADALAGNLCRCGTYPNVIDAVLAIANHEPAKRNGVELIRVRREGAR
jgi:xanthine dehydrogenase YagT iron-sulfur-binding subunit